MKYLVELNSDVKADYLLSELQEEFGKTSAATGDPEISKLDIETGSVHVLSDYENNRLWITVETASGQNYRDIAHRIEDVLNKSKDRGFIQWSQMEIPH